MNAAEQFNKLDGQLRVSRKTLENLLSKAKKERDTRVSSRVIVILDKNPEKTVFTIQLKNLIKPYSLNGARHNGIAKVGLDECGRLQPGFLFDGRGNVIPAIGQEKTRPARKCTPSCDKPKITVRNNPSVSKTTLDKSKKAVKSLVKKLIVKTTYYYSFNKLISEKTINNYAIIGWNPKKLNDKKLCDAYAHSLFAEYLIENSLSFNIIRTKLLSESGKKELINILKTEVEKRKLNFKINIDLLKYRVVKPVPPSNDNNNNNQKKNIDLEKSSDVYVMKLANIHLDTKRFQNRDKLDENKVKEIVNNFDPLQFDPLIIWHDPKQNKDFLLAGHHRFEALKRLKKTTAQVKFDNQKTEAQAIHYAIVQSNANRTMEQPFERAKIYRNHIIADNLSKKEVLDLAKINEGKNATKIINLSYLSPNGIVVGALKSLAETPDVTNAKIIETIADWIGEARRNNDQLTNLHEKEMFDFLQDRNASLRIKTKGEFLQKVIAATGLYFDYKTALNLKRFANKTAGESVYETEFKELKGKIDFLNDARADLKDRISNPKNKQYINPKDKDYKLVLDIFDKQLKKYEIDLKAYQKQQLSLMQNKGNYTKAGSNQVGLFKPKNPSLNQPEINVNSLAYKQQNKVNQAHEYYIIPDPEIAKFLGKVEKKNKESVVITLAGGEGSMKTRLCFQFMNCFAQNYKVGHASIEEHPESALYENKINQYLTAPNVLNNITAPEISTIQDVHNLVKNNDVIIIDSFSKLEEMQRGIGLDKDFRKAYDGKLFIIIFQLTSDGKMRGGSKSQFDGDIIGKINVEPDYKNNTAYFSKNRYCTENLSTHKFNIFEKKLVELPGPQNEILTEKLSFKIK